MSAPVLDDLDQTLQDVAGLASARGGKTVEHERLIPFVAAYIDEVSLPERRITVDWGLDF